MRTISTVLLLCGLGIFLAGAETEPSWDTLERQFRQLPPEARRLLGPLFWLHGDESPERLQMYVEKVAEGGNGCFTTESRPHKDWLGEGWYHDLGICLAAAKKNGLKMWIFDEKWWPSGEVAGKVPQQYGSKRLLATATNITGPARFSAANFEGTNFIAVVSGRETADGIDGASLVDLTKDIRNGSLEWNVPDGNWKIIKFTYTVQKAGSRYLVDGASADAVDWYLRTVYQPHYDRFKDEFGKTIVGFFYDEPETHGDWGTEVMKVLQERGVDWKRALVAWKFKLAGEEHVAARYQYQDAFAEAWGRTLFGGVSRWCKAHQVVSIGHFLEHANEYLHPNLCAGNMFQLQKYSDMGGIDAVFDQFVWGKRVARDAPCWQTPKLGSSITHAYGKAEDIAMVEIFGARGQDITYPEMKWWTDHMQVSGVNFLIPHSFNPRAPFDTDCPPYFYNGGFEPRWPLYRVYADYTCRLSLMLTGGRHVCPVALLFLGGSAHVGKRVLPDQISESLQDALYDSDWIPYDVFENDMQIAGRELRLRSEIYRVLIVPAAEVIPYPTMAKIKAFYDAGGVVVGYGILPDKSATLGKTSADISALREAIWGTPLPGMNVCKVNAAGGRSYFLPEKPTPEQLWRVLAEDAGVRPTLEVIEGKTDNWLHVLHRVKAGRDVFFIANQNLSGGPRKFQFRIRAAGEPECWDPMRNEITAVPNKRKGETTELELALHPNESVLLVFQPVRRQLPLRGDGAAAKQTISLTRVALPEQPDLTPVTGPLKGRAFEGGSWIWYPEGNPAQGVPPGRRYFRKQITIPAERKLAKAVFTGTADNDLVLFINGSEAARSDESGEGWRNPIEADVTKWLRPGLNQLAMEAFNGDDKPNPAAVIGRLTLTFGEGEPMVVWLDGTWKAAREKAAGWLEAGFDDSKWLAAKIVAPYGRGPWGRLDGRRLTLSPVSKATPYLGFCEIPANLLSGNSVIFLEMEGMAPEAAARVTINGRYAGGVIGLPLRLPITTFLTPGRNEIRIEPFAPTSAQLVVQ